jgi:hypothetical protein
MNEAKCYAVERDAIGANRDRLAGGAGFKHFARPLFEIERVIDSGSTGKAGQADEYKYRYAENGHASSSGTRAGRLYCVTISDVETRQKQ